MSPQVLGLNRRNALIARENPRSAIRLVRDKAETKRRLRIHGIPVPRTLLRVDTPRDVAHADWEALGDGWVMKPVHGSQGRGVLVVTARTTNGWRRADGTAMSLARVRHHALEILDGAHGSGTPDSAIVEPILRPHPQLAPLAPVGLPDVRVICHRHRVLMAMMRIPTGASGGRSNLHQGGIGAAVDLDSGRIARAVLHGQPIDTHPDTGAPLVGSSIPSWTEILDVAARCGRATGLGYLGADIVIDATEGVTVLEVNAHPGLEIQNVCARGLLPLVAG